MQTDVFAAMRQRRLLSEKLNKLLKPIDKVGYKCYNSSNSYLTDRISQNGRVVK